MSGRSVSMNWKAGTMVAQKLMQFLARLFGPQPEMSFERTAAIRPEQRPDKRPEPQAAARKIAPQPMARTPLDLGPMRIARPDDPARNAELARRRAKAALVDALSPGLPVEDRGQLLGRDAEMERVFAAITELRGHALIYGARGAGKTSLARAFGDYADERGLLVIYLSCEGGRTSFAKVFRPYLEFLPENCFARGQAAEAAAAIAHLPEDFGPAALANVLSRITEQRVTFIIDEFDRVTDEDTRRDVATLVKLLSDFRAMVHLLFVGIARDAHDLIQGHASLRRHLVAIGLRKFNDGSVKALLDEGERRSGVGFDDDARALMTRVAAGSPYHLRLFAFNAGLAAIAADSRSVTSPLLVQGLRSAFETWGSVNPNDAMLFQSAVAEGPVQRRALEALALGALDADSLTVESLGASLRSRGDADGPGTAAAVIDRMRPALVPLGETESFVFEDTLAPQFLLLSCCFAEGGRAAAGKDLS